jgi:predicted enzyme related to lactoylglutathione lyase
MPKFCHVEIAADRVDRAVQFYKKVFEWDMERDEEAQEEYWLVNPQEDEPNITAGIVQRAFPDDSTMPTYEVTSVDGFARRIVGAGGTVYEDVPIILPGIGYMHYCADSEGNAFGILQYDEKAI